jgi:hypothetical protein
VEVSATAAADVSFATATVAAGAAAKAAAAAEKVEGGADPEEDVSGGGVDSGGHSGDTKVGVSPGGGCGPLVMCA